MPPARHRAACSQSAYSSSELDWAWGTRAGAVVRLVGLRRRARKARLDRKHYWRSVDRALLRTTALSGDSDARNAQVALHTHMGNFRAKMTVASSDVDCL